MSRAYDWSIVLRQGRIGMSTNLPEFSNPPVVEVALSVQFEPLKFLHSPQLGLLYQRFRGRFPKTEEHAPLEPKIERFETPAGPQARIQIKMMHESPVPRCWFVNDHGTELVQIQQDRFTRNWRKVIGDENYPRYENHIRPSFKEDLVGFEEFILEEGIGKLIPTQCEVTYVNHIVSGAVWQQHGQTGKVLTLFAPKYSEVFLPDLEEARVSGSFVVPGADGEPIGRLRFSVEPAFRRKDDVPLLVLNLVARGRPQGVGIPGVMSFLDTGRNWIVRGFAAITTPEMHRMWGRKQ